jgi:hypothetical protein
MHHKACIQQQHNIAFQQQNINAVVSLMTQRSINCTKRFNIKGKADQNSHIFVSVTLGTTLFQGDY